MAALARGLAGQFAVSIDDRHCRLVCRDDFIPHPKGQKNMRGHVLRVARVRCDPGVDARGAQSERSMNGIIVTMNEVMHDARMPWVQRKDFFEYRGCTHVGCEIASLFRRS